MRRKKKKHLVFVIMRLSVIPIIVLGIILTVYSQNSVREGMIFEVEKNLSGIAHNLISVYDMLDAGDFSYKDGKVMKGETDFTSDYRLLDDIKNDTGADATIFVEDERCLTTLVSDEGKRLIGTKANEKVKKIVLEEGQEYFSQDVNISGVDYFAYYVPIRNDENKVIGMSFAGKSVQAIKTSMEYMIQGNIIICLFVILLAVVLCNISVQRMVAVIQAIKKFLSNLAQGNFAHSMSAKVTKRRDELGEIGEYAVIVSESLEDLVSRDPLTKLLNRRMGWSRLRERADRAPFSIVMADIDFFKKVNDTYEHDKGDEVLYFVAKQLKASVEGIGFCARWGGEEFLLGFDTNVEQTVQMLESLKEKMEQKEFQGNGEMFSVTMTFGVVAYHSDESLENAIQRADKLLYYGKNHGRNQIVEESKTD